MAISRDGMDHQAGDDLHDEVYPSVYEVNGIPMDLSSVSGWS